MVGVVMIGQLGEVPVAAVGLANQMFFLLQLVIFGITSGAAIFTAQLWESKTCPTSAKCSAWFAASRRRRPDFLHPGGVQA